MLRLFGLRTLYIPFFFFNSTKFLYVELANWTQFRSSQFCCQHPKHQSNLRLLFSFRPGQGVALGHVKATERLHSLSDLVLVGLDITMDTSTLLRLLSSSWLTREGNLMVVQWSGLFLPGVLFRGYLRCCRSLFGRRSVGDLRIFLLCGYGRLSALISLPSKPLLWV